MPNNQPTLRSTVSRETTLSQHQSDAVKARWARTTPAQRSAYAKRMVDAREAKRATAKAGTANPPTQPLNSQAL